jgi:hypothetical protein
MMSGKIEPRGLGRNGSLAQTAIGCGRPEREDRTGAGITKRSAKPRGATWKLEFPVSCRRPRELSEIQSPSMGLTPSIPDSVWPTRQYVLRRSNYR